MSIAAILAAASIMGTPMPIDGAFLESLPVATVSFTAHGQASTCEGPRLRDVIAKMGAPVGDAVRGPALTQGVLVTARDGYRVIFTLGELDAKLGASEAIVATRCDGSALTDKDGPVRLVVPGEQRAARSVRQVKTMALVELAPERE